MEPEDFEISGGIVEKDRADGGKDLVVQLGEASMTVSAGRMDIVLKDRDGNVVRDTRQERIIAKQKLARLVADKRGSDKILDAMLDSYANAVKDPNDELVYLYEIREALVSRFGSDSAAISAVGISRKRWSTLGRLANDEPLNQGRHRGKSPADLRDATADELDRARSIAREMIKLYSTYLDENRGR